jgi:hypothetical protein
MVLASNGYGVTFSSGDLGDLSLSGCRDLLYTACCIMHSVGCLYSDVCCLKYVVPCVLCVVPFLW